MPGPVNFVKDGSVLTLTDPNDIANAIDQGWQPETPTQHAAGVSSEVRTERYGGPAGKVVAAGAGVLRTVTGGASDVALSALGGQRDLAALRAENPITSAVSEIGAAFVPFGAPALAARAGRSVTALGAEAGALGKVGAAAAGGTVEGALFGAGTGVSELALSQDPLTVERIASSLSSHTLYGAGIGAAAGTLGKTAELGLRRAKGAIDGALERRALSKARTPVEAIESGDLSRIDKRILDSAEKTEVERIRVERAPERKAFTDELNTWRKANRDAHDIRSIASASDDPNLREAGGAFDRANLRLRAALDDRAGFADDPLASSKAVRVQAQALDEMRAAALQQQRMWQEAVDTAPQRFRAEIEAISSKPTLRERTAEARARGLVDYTGPFTPAGLDTAAARAVKEYSTYQWGGAIRHGLGEPSIVSRIPKIDEMIAANQRLQSQLEALAKPPTSDLLTKIAEARAVLDAPKQPSLAAAGAAAVGAVVPFAGQIGAAAAAGNRVLGSFKQLAAAATTRAGKAASAFLGAAAPATKYATPLATKVLAAARFGDDDRKAQPTSLPELYKARSTEVRNQVHIAADGTYQMRPAARAKMARKFDGIRVADPILADQLETSGARRLEYLASILPRLTDFGTVQIGPERRLPPDLEMRRWARSVAALEDPGAVLERAAHGHVTPAEVAALRAVHAPVLDAFTQDVIAQLPTLQKNLPRKKRLALSILTGVPVDPTLTPTVLRVVQGMYASEPGTEGGTMAPRAQAQFGSVKRSDPGTASQRRQEGTAT